MLSSITKTIASQPRRVLSGLLSRSYSSNTELQFETLAVSTPKPNVYHVELNRPTKLNTFNYPMWIELQKCFSTLSEESECRVIVLSAQGKHFTGGIDLKSMVELSQKANEFDDIARKAKYLYKVIGIYQDGISSLEKCVKPILGVSHSACVGAGVDLLTAADMRYCTQDAWFQVKEADIGLAADVGTLQRLPKVIGNSSTARELCFTARKFDAKEALEIGLVTRIYADKDSAVKSVLEIAESIASKSPVAIQTTKKSLIYSQNRTNEEGLEHIRLINQVMLQSEDLTKAAMAQAMKLEKPDFENL